MHSQQREGHLVHELDGHGGPAVIQGREELPPEHTGTRGCNRLHEVPALKLKIISGVLLRSDTQRHLYDL